MEELTQMEVDAEIERRVDQGLCLECSAPEASPKRFMRVMSFMVFTRHREWESFLCPACTARTGVKELAISSALGWWGVPWGLLTFKAIWLNVNSLMQSNTFGRVSALSISALLAIGVVGVVNGVRSAQEEEEQARATGDWVSDHVYDDYEHASQAFERGALVEAQAAIRRAHGGAPDSAAINSLYGYIEWHLGEDIDAAERHLLAANDLAPNDEDFAFAAASVCRALGNEEQARARLQRFVEGGDAALELHELYQDASLALGTQDELVELYRARAAAEPDSAWLAYLQGRVAPDPVERATHLRRALKGEPELNQARGVLVDTLIELRELDEARAECARLAPPAPGDPPRIDHLTVIALASGRVAEALERIDGVIAEREDPWAHMQRGTALSALERYEEARAAIATAAELSGATDESALMFDLYANRMLVEAGELDAAATELEHIAGALDDPAPDSRLELGLRRATILKLSGDLDGALAAYAACPEDAESVWTTWRTPALHRAELLALRGDGEGARELWTRVANSKDDERDGETIATAQLFLKRISPESYLDEVKYASYSFDNNAHYYVGLYHELAGRAAQAEQSYQASLAATLGNDTPAAAVRIALERLATASDG
jgi:tetratricopeptide (TPR) repeat protein